MTRQSLECPEQAIYCLGVVHATDDDIMRQSNIVVVGYPIPDEPALWQRGGQEWP